MGLGKIQTQTVFARTTGRGNMIQSQAADTSCMPDSALGGITRLGGMQVRYSFFVLRGSIGGLIGEFWGRDSYWGVSQRREVDWAMDGDIEDGWGD